MAAPTTNDDWVAVKTTLPTLPLPSNENMPSIKTDRLISRALSPEDLQSLHNLRTQPEVMAQNHQGRVDSSLDETKPHLDRFLPPNDENTSTFAICLKETGEMIGIGGCYSLHARFGWPAIGYMLRREYWSQGLMTEFVRAWLDMWWKLPREVTQIKVDPQTLVGVNRDSAVIEQVALFTVAEYIGSRRVLEKAGFEHFLTWQEPDLRNTEVDVTLMGFRTFAPESKTL